MPVTPVEGWRPFHLPAAAASRQKPLSSRRPPALGTRAEKWQVFTPVSTRKEVVVVVVVVVPSPPSLLPDETSPRSLPEGQQHALSVGYASSRSVCCAVQCFLPSPAIVSVAFALSPIITVEVNILILLPFSSISRSPCPIPCSPSSSYVSSRSFSLFVFRCNHF
eukprot:gene9294-6534_t